MLETRILTTPPYQEDPRPISVPISGEEMATAVREIVDRLEESRRYWQPMHDQLETDRTLYKAHQTRANKPHETACELIVPMLTYTHSNLQARMKRALFTPNPQFNFEGRDDLAKHLAQFTEDAMQREIGPEYIDLPAKLVPTIDGQFQDGTSIILWRWRQEPRVRKTFAMVQRPLVNPYTGQPMLDPMMGGPMLTPPAVEVVPEQFPFYDNMDIVKLDKEQVDLWPPQSTSIEECKGFGARMIYTYNEMLVEAMQGNFDMSAVLYLRDHYAGDYYEPSTEHKRKEMDGDSDAVTRNIANRPYKLTECYWLYSPPGYTGPARMYLITIHEPTYTVLRFRENPWWHGMIPAVEWSSLPGKYGILGRSLPDLLGDNQQMTSLIMQTVVDALRWMVDPAYAVRRGALSKPEIELFKRRLSPHSIWEVNGDPQSVLTPVMRDAGNPLAGLQVIEILRQFGARVSSVDDINLGKSSPRQTTATEIEEMLQEGEVMFTEMVDNLARSYLRTGRILRMSMAQMAGHPTIQRVWREAVGDDPTGMMALQALWADYDIEVAGSAAAANAALRKRNTLELYQILMQNPLTAQWLPRVYELTSLVLNEYNQRYPEKLIGTPQDAAMMQMVMMQQQQLAMQQQAAAEQGAGQGNPSARQTQQ